MLYLGVMYTPFYLLLLFLSYSSIAQIEVEVTILPDSINDKAKYPRIKLASEASNKAVAKLIRKEVFDRKNQRNKIEEAISGITKDSTTLDYEILYNKKGLLSLEVKKVRDDYVDKSYMNLMIEEKVKNIQLKDILTPRKDFLNLVALHRIEQLTQYQNILGDQSKDTLKTMKLAIEQIEVCKLSFVLTDFYLNDDGITIIDNCEFPLGLEELQPEAKMFYSYDELHDYLKISP